jgi:hypothetical protein
LRDEAVRQNSITEENSKNEFKKGAKIVEVGSLQMELVAP